MEVIHLNIAIVDDSVDDRERLSEDLKRYALEHTLQAQISLYKSGEAFLSKADLEALDVVFLDIYMDDMTGMDVASIMRSQGCECKIIFVTTSPAFAVESYNVNALYYVVKPYIYEDISNAFERLMQTQKKSLEYITVKEGRDKCKILVSDILYVDYSNHYVQIHTKSGIIRSYMKFPEIEITLNEYPQFMSCYRCIAVNMNKIKKISDLFFILENGEYIPINRKRVKEIKACYSDYIFGLIEEECHDDRQ